MNAPVTEAHRQLALNVHAAVSASATDGPQLLANFCAQAVEAAVAKYKPLPALLLEARDALPAISITSARLHNIDLTLADRIEAALEPWRVS